MIPTFIIQIWLFGLLSLGFLGAGAYFAHEWQQRSWSWDPIMQTSVFQPTLGFNEDTAVLAAAVGFLFITFFGGSLVRLILALTRATRQTPDVAPRDSLTPRISKQLARPDGTTLRVEVYGPENGLPIVLTHGWGLDSSEWTYFKRAMADRYRLIVWDLPGLGRSTAPENHDFSLEKLANDLHAVLDFAGAKRAILLGHSIGGMTVLTFCRLFPEAVATRVQALVLTHTTPTNPVRTTSGASVLTAIQNPVLVPLMHLTIALSPIVRVLNWLSYRNGSMHLSTKQGSFAGTETWAQIDFAARFQLRASPAVVARGMLGMMQYDATATLHSIPVPTLVIAADKDTTTLPSASHAIQTTIPRADLLTLAPGKHLGLIEHHEEYAIEVGEFAQSTHILTPAPSPVHEPVAA